MAGTDARRLELLLVEFDRGWDERRLARMAEQLAPGDPLRPAALREMVKIDLAKHIQLGRRPRVEAYLRLYPELGTPETVPADLLLAEFQARRRPGDTPQQEEAVFWRRSDPVRKPG
jgi:hypothetical protein